MLRPLIALSIFLIAILIWLNAEQPKDVIRLGGGPEGGTFIVYAEGLAKQLRAELPEKQIDIRSSGGSVSNLLDVDQGRVDIALVYAGDAYLGSRGQLKNRPEPTSNVQALARVYGSTAQLVVLKNSVIETPEDLDHRRVAIGSSGSGAAHSAERYFRILGLWDDIIPLYLGYDQAMKELTSRRAQAVWQLVGAPSSSIVNTNRRHPLRLVDLSELAEQSDFLLEYPFYSSVSIPADTYVGQTEPVDSFQDNTLLAANRETDPELISTLLRKLFSPKGLQQMGKVHQVGKDLAVEKGMQGVHIPLHPEAEKFWRERNAAK